MGAIMESAITVKGQATIPRAVRKHLGLKPGDRVKFFVHPDGSVVLLPKLPASALRGIVRHQGRPVTVEEMTEAAGAGAPRGPRGRQTRGSGGGPTSACVLFRQTHPRHRGKRPALSRP